MDAYPEAKVVASKMAFTMMKNMFGTDFADRQVTAAEGTVLELGKTDGAHTLRFITAPNVHWPEVIMTYDAAEKILFSADAFGKFGALDYEDPEGWACEARRYYFGIVGKFGAQVQAVLKKAAALDIAAVCPLHGPVLSDNLKVYFDLYDCWASYRPESKGVFIAYTSVYGNTKQTADELARVLVAKGCPSVVVSDLAREDMFECVEDAFRYGTLVLAASSYDAGLFPPAAEFISHLQDKGWQNRRVGLIENGSWAPSAGRVMKERFAAMKNVTILEPLVTIRSSMKDSDLPAMQALSESVTAQPELA